ncbi:hypothetical protein BDV26DRAFT_273401 [Aspergillus bertholletiae]|uniref:Uncharacterized protein n=1 Tax=Aspergillus bertholletiae TaxID=1226010 RepID=A0A5N7AU20_9EURO|nr:hypothetical protein BDV26DRAFT_273401 [Aspergillus bertholletiae]
MFIEMGVKHSPPEDPTVKYIKEEAATFVKDLSSRPTTKLTYNMPSEAPTKGSWQFQLNITDETNNKLTIEAFHITIPVGNVETDLFARPKITEGSSDPPENRIQCTVSEPDRFIVTSAISPNRDNHTMLFQVAAKDKTAVFGQLQVTFTGTLNELAGKSNINIKEIPPKEGKDKPEDSRTDLVRNMTIQKK